MSLAVPLILFAAIVTLAVACTVNVFRSIELEDSEEEVADCCTDNCPCGGSKQEPSDDAESTGENETLI